MMQEASQQEDPTIPLSGSPAPCYQSNGMKMSTGSHEALMIGCVSGMLVFALLEMSGQSPLWVSCGVFMLVFGIAFPFIRIHRRSISVEDAVLILSHGNNETRLQKSEIESYLISKMNRYEISFFLFSGEAVVMPIQGFFSEQRIIEILDSLGIADRRK